jgi:hypothetical protein
MIILSSQASIDPMEYLYILSGCALGYHYNTFQCLNLVCSTPIEVSPEVSVQTTKGPLLCHVVLMRVHSFTNSFPTRRIHRESTLPAPPIGMPNKPLPHTKPSHTHIGSWLHYSHWWSLHKSVLRFGHDDHHRLLESIGQSSELSESTEHSSNPINPNPYSPH